MASSIPATIAGKPSFAKVAAMKPPPKVVRNQNAQGKATDLQKDTSSVSPKVNSSPPAKVAPASPGTPTNQNQANDKISAVTDGIDRLSVMTETSPHRSSNEISKIHVPVAGVTEDDGSHLSNSSTKPPSFDTKSMASENTFALDEKESLRPDDSASVQATDEDEPFFVPPISGRPDNQVALERGSMGMRRPLQDESVPVNLAVQRLPVTTMANPPRFGEIMPGVLQCFPQNVTSNNHLGANHLSLESPHQYSPAPMPLDERLIEAMGTPKDRLLLLQLEEKFLAFIIQSKDATLDLPPQNSYERLLTHKLADYYTLARNSSADSNSIRLFKAVEVRLPTPLSELVGAIGGRDVPPTGPTAVKIMRRTALAGKKASNDGSTAASSSAPSKATSEAGAETTSDEGLPSPPNATSSKDRSKLTREEKEAHYKVARERIFRDFQEAQNSENSTADTSANMSRSSSSSGKKKGYKQKAPRNDSFEARSSYVPGFPGMPHSSQSQYNGPYAPGGYPSPFGNQTPNPSPAVPFGSNSTPAYNQYEPSATYTGTTYMNAYLNQYGSTDAWSNLPPPQPNPYFGFAQQSAANYPPYGPAMSSPMNQYPPIASPANQPPNQQWGPAQYSQPFQAQPPMPSPMAQNGALMSWQGYPSHSTAQMPGTPYPYGQAPFQQYPSTPPPNGQHPLPGSYNRSAFNPQIRSFVPAVPGGPWGQVSQIRAPISNFSGQASISSQNTERPDSGVRASLAPNKAQESLQKKWGTPAHLPKKPPPSQVPSTFEMENTPSLPSQQSFSPLASSIAKASPPIGNN